MREMVPPVSTSLWRHALARNKNRRSSGMGKSKDQPSDPVLVAAQKLAEADRLRKDGHLPRARRICEDLLKSYPDYVGALHTLGTVQYDMNQYKKSLATLNQANSICPDNWQILVALARNLVQTDRIDEALSLLDRAQELEPDQIATLNTYAKIWQIREDYRQAARSLEKLVEINPDDTESKNQLLSCYGKLGLSHKVVALFNDLAQLGKANLDALAAMAELPSEMIEIDLLAALNATELPTDDEKTFASFLKARIFHRRENYADAWNQLLLANEAVAPTFQSLWPTDREDRVREVAKIRSKVTPYTRLVESNDVQISLFILGPSRSGKSTVEKLIARNRNVVTGFENRLPDQALRRTMQFSRCIEHFSLSDLPEEFFTDYRSHYEKLLRRKIGDARVFTNTAPGMLSNVSALESKFPGSRVVFINRGREDLAFRIFMQNYRPGTFSCGYDLTFIHEYISWYNDMSVALAARLPETSLTLNYEDVIEDPEAAIRSISKLCGIEPELDDLPDIGDDRNVSAPYREFMKQALTDVE